MSLDVVQAELSLLGEGSAWIKDDVLWLEVRDALPASASHFKKVRLKCLDHKVPDNLEVLEDVEYLDLSFNAISSVPGGLGKLRNLKELNLSDNKLTYLPNSFGKLRNLEELDLSYNELTSLPESFGKLKKLKELDLSLNEFTSLLDFLENFRKDMPWCAVYW